MLNQAYSDEFYMATEFISFVNSIEGRYELIDGHIYMMSSPSVTHQRLVRFIYDMFTPYFKEKKCEVFISPLDVFLHEKTINDCINVYQPDVFVVCNKSIIKERGIEGSLDFVAEIISKSTSYNDYIYKLKNYMHYGVKEYWIINYDSQQITTFLKTDAFDTKTYNFTDTIESGIFTGLRVDFSLFERG